MKRSHKLAVAFWIVLTAMVIIETLFFRRWMDSSAYILTTGLMLSALALGWVLYDSRENDLTISKHLKVGVVAAAALAVPYYRFRYFGAKSGFIFLAIVALNTAGIVLIATLLEHLPISR